LQAKPARWERWDAYGNRSCAAVRLPAVLVWVGLLPAAVASGMA